MAGKFVAPEAGLVSFTCPKCETLCPQYKTTFYIKSEMGLGRTSVQTVHSTWLTSCADCSHEMLWHDGKVVHPPISAAPHPHQDLPEEFVEDYEEARAIVGRSPRGAAALLRYIIDGLTIKLRGAKGGSLNDRIGYLVEHKGLSPMAQQALDSVRVIGAHAVHPLLALDLRDNPELATKLFTLINGIVEDTITRPKAVEEIYKALPSRQLEAIETRDGVPNAAAPSKPDGS